LQKNNKTLNKPNQAVNEINHVKSENNFSLDEKLLNEN
jgi:hypothetical protein